MSSLYARTVVGLALLVCTSVTSTEAASDPALTEAQHPVETRDVGEMAIVRELAYDANTWGRDFDMSNVQAMPVDTPGYSCAGYVCAPSHPAPPYMQQILMHIVTCACRLEMLIIIPGACIGQSPNCFGINMGGFPGWAQLSLIMFPSRTVHNLFTPSCVGWGTGNFGPERNGEPISDEFSRNVWLP